MEGGLIGKKLAVADQQAAAAAQKLNQALTLKLGLEWRVSNLEQARDLLQIQLNAKEDAKAI